MAIYGALGVIKGGWLSVPTGSTSIIELSSFKIKLNSGRITGSGVVNGSTTDKTKQINVTFGGTSDSTLYQRAATLVPQFYLNIAPSTINSCWVYYDEGIDDIGLQIGGSLPANTVVFGKITWNNASNISQISFDYASRTESYLAIAPAPSTSKNLYYDGQPWIAGSKNTPLTALNTISELITNQNDYVLGSNYFFTKLTESKIKAKNLTVVIKEFKSYSKNEEEFIIYDTKRHDVLNTLNGIVLSNGGNNNQIENTTELFTLKINVGDTIKINNSITTNVTAVTDTVITISTTLSNSLVGNNVTLTGDSLNIAWIHTFPTLASVQGQTIYIVVNKTTGIPNIKTEAPTTSEWLVATGFVSSTETNLGNVTWNINQSYQGLYNQVLQTNNYRKSVIGNGFVMEPEIQEINVPDSFIFKNNILILNGDIIKIPTTQITLSPAPITGSRQDFVFLHIKKELNPFAEYDYSFNVVSGVNFSSYVDPFSQPGLITNHKGNPFTFSERNIYEALDSDNEDEGVSFAIPICVVHRFNQTVYTPGSNDNGGTGRLDNKTHNFIKLDEIENRTFHINIVNKDINSYIYKLLNGDLNNILQPSHINNTVYSRQPLQIDKLGGSGSTPGTSLIGYTDDIRYLWGVTQEEVWAYGIIKEDMDSGSSPYNFSCISYNSTTKTIQIQIPTGSIAELVVDEFGQPKDLEMRWVTTGLPVGLVNASWSVGTPNVAFNIIKTSGDPNYIAGGLIAVSFKIKYIDNTTTGLTKIPSTYINAALNTYLPTNLDNSFALADNKHNTSLYYKDMPRTTTINSMSYTDKLYTKFSDSTYKYYTYEYHYYAPGNGNNANEYEIPDSIIISGEVYGFVGLVDVKRVSTNESLSVDKVRWTYNTTSKFFIRLNDSYTPQPTEAIVFIFAVGGDANKQIDIDTGSLSLSLKQTNIYQMTGSSVPTTTHPDSDKGIYRFSIGKLVFGFSSCKLNKILNYVVYVGEDLVPCTVTGIGRNLVTIDISQTNISNYTVTNWTLVSGKYVPSNGVTIRFITLNNYRLISDHIYLVYLYKSLPFKPWEPTSGRYFNDYTTPLKLNKKNTNILERGVLLLSTDGRGNGKASFASPLSERFPKVQNIEIIGQNVSSGLLGWNDVLSYQQEILPFVEGLDINMDNQFILNVVVEPGSGQAIWIAKVLTQGFIRLFIYVVSNGKFMLKDKNQAFLCELDYVTVK